MSASSDDAHPAITSQFTCWSEAGLSRMWVTEGNTEGGLGLRALQGCHACGSRRAIRAYGIELKIVIGVNSDTVTVTLIRVNFELRP